jgi:hypothetical protein
MFGSNAGKRKVNKKLIIKRETSINREKRQNRTNPSVGLSELDGRTAEKETDCFE